VGAQITKASLYNYEKMMEFKFHKGDKIIISRRNDVIPAVEENLTKNSEGSKDLILSKCPSCGNKLKIKGVHLHCDNKECPEVNMKKIIYWVKQCEMTDVSEKTIQTLFNKKLIKNVKDLYFLKKEQMIGIEGFGEKTIDNIINEISKTKEMTISQFIGRLGIPLILEKTVKNLEIKNIQDFWNLIKKEQVNFVAEENIKKWMREEKNYNFFIELINIISIKTEEIKQGEKKMKVCMTGSDPWKKGRNTLVEEIEKKGYEFSNTVTKDTKILICENIIGNSTKLQKAKKDGIKLVSYQEFFGE
jgi:DNA ligase (NAD+)